MNAPIMRLSGSAVSVTDPIWQLGTVGDYTTAALGSLAASERVGASSGLTLEFSNFKKKNDSNQFADITQFSDITSDTWTQVSKLMNMFAKYESGQSVSNLDAWTVKTGEESESTSVIQADIADGKLNQEEDQGVKWTVNSTQKVITNTDSEATLKHNGVTWTYKNPRASGVSSRDGDTTTGNSITITGSVNLYRSKNGSTSYQIIFVINK